MVDLVLFDLFNLLKLENSNFIRINSNKNIFNRNKSTACKLPLHLLQFI